MHMLSCHVRAQNNWRGKIVTITFVIHGNTGCTGMCNQDGTTCLCRLTGSNVKTEIKKTVNLSWHEATSYYQW